MSTRNVIAIGGSAGAVEALVSLVKDLPPDLPAAVLITIHTLSRHESHLAEVLSRVARMEVQAAQDGAPVCEGNIYVSMPDLHLSVLDGRLKVSRGPRENGHRPAIDVLFRTAAVAYGRRAIGVVLTGSDDDGTAGLAAIKRRGGMAVVQAPDDARYPTMPRSALDHVHVDYVAPLHDLPGLLTDLVRKRIQPDGEAEGGGDAVPEHMEKETREVQIDLDVMGDDDKPGKPSAFGCPDCGGVLWELHDDVLRYRCRVGHAYSPESLEEHQSASFEAALWTALRTLEESASLKRRLARQMRQRDMMRSAARFEAQARELEEPARQVRALLLNDQAFRTENPHEAEPEHTRGERQTSK